MAHSQKSPPPSGLGPPKWRQNYNPWTCHATQTMACHATPGHAHAIPCRAVQCHAIPCQATLHATQAAPTHALPRLAMSYHVMQRPAIQCCATPCHATPYQHRPCHTAAVSFRARHRMAWHGVPPCACADLISLSLERTRNPPHTTTKRGGGAYKKMHPQWQAPKQCTTRGYTCLGMLGPLPFKRALRSRESRWAHEAVVPMGGPLATKAPRCAILWACPGSTAAPVIPRCYCCRWQPPRPNVGRKKRSAMGAQGLPKGSRPRGGMGEGGGGGWPHSDH